MTLKGLLSATRHQTRFWETHCSLSSGKAILSCSLITERGKIKLSTHSDSFGSSLFLPKKQTSPFATSKVRERVLLGTDIVPIPSQLLSIDWVPMVGVGGSWFKTKAGILHQRENSSHGNSTKGVILFFSYAHLWCQFSNTASIFPEVSLIQHFNTF